MSREGNILTEKLSIGYLDLLRGGKSLLITNMSWKDLRTPENEAFLNQGLFSACRARYWLMPHGAPFPAERFGAEIERRFQMLYRHAASTAEMDIWECRAEP
jgi:hypothetical protein